MGNLSSDCVDPSMNGRHRKESLVFIKPENDGMANQSTNQIPSSFQSLLDLYRNHQNRSPFGDESNVLSTPVKNHDYRGFCFMIHPKHGILLLQCSKLKKNKPSPHFQVPGGHIDNFEFHQQQHLINYPLQQLYAASRCGCAREVFEETGIDLRHDLHRFKPVFLNINETRAKGVLCNDYKHRLFFIVILTDSDFRFDTAECSFSEPLDNETSGTRLKLKLSHEHTGFKFESQPRKAIELLKHHSGGKVSTALKLTFHGQ